MDILNSVLLTGHILGLALIIGSFFVQLRRKGDFALMPTLIGAITQVITGLGLVGLAEASDGDIVYAKIAVKLVIALIVLGAAIAAVVVQRKGGRTQPFFHAAGGLAIVNVVVAVFWH